MLPCKCQLQCCDVSYPYRLDISWPDGMGILFWCASYFRDLIFYSVIICVSPEGLLTKQGLQMSWSQSFSGFVALMRNL